MSLNLNNNAVLDIQGLGVKKDENHLFGIKIADAINNILPSKEGNEARRKARLLKAEGTYAEKTGLATALADSSATSRTAGGDNTMIYVIVGVVLLIIVGGGLFYALKD